MVAVSDYCRYPPSIKNLPRVGTSLELNIERLLRAKSGVVYMEKSAKQLSQRQLQKLNLNIRFYSTNRLSDLFYATKNIAKYLGVSKRGKQIVDRFDQGLSPMRVSKRILIVVGSVLSAGKLMSAYIAGKDNYYHDILMRLNLINVGAVKDGSFVVDREFLKRLKVNHVFLLFPGSVSTGKVKETFEAWKKMVGNKVSVVHKDDAVIPGMRGLNLVKDIKGVLSQ